MLDHGHDMRDAQSFELGFVARGEEVCEVKTGNDLGGGVPAGACAR